MKNRETSPLQLNNSILAYDFPAVTFQNEDYPLVTDTEDLLFASMPEANGYVNEYYYEEINNNTTDEADSITVLSEQSFFASLPPANGAITEYEIEVITEDTTPDYSEEISSNSYKQEIIVTGEPFYSFGPSKESIGLSRVANIFTQKAELLQQIEEVKTEASNQYETALRTAEQQGRLVWVDDGDCLRAVIVEKNGSYRFVSEHNPQGRISSIATNSLDRIDSVETSFRDDKTGELITFSSLELSSFEQNDEIQILSLEDFELIAGPGAIEEFAAMCADGCGGDHGMLSYSASDMQETHNHAHLYYACSCGRVVTLHGGGRKQCSCGNPHIKKCNDEISAKLLARGLKKNKEKKLLHPKRTIQRQVRIAA